MTTSPSSWAAQTARRYGQSAVLYAALALSAPGEYALARMVGWEPAVAWLMPAVLSLYAAIGASISKAQRDVMRRAIGTPVEKEARRRSRNASVGALLALALATAAQITWHVITAETYGSMLWVVVAVSAVPPLVAAHVLHIDPPVELPDEPSEALAETPLTSSTATHPWDSPTSRARHWRERRRIPLRSRSWTLRGTRPKRPPKGPVKGTQEPVLVSYTEAATALGVAPETVRGWANNGKVTKYPGPKSGTVRVDLKQCRAEQPRRPVSV
ncbi:hypothetical protein [Streptomyces sp. CAU 1734]|uniref:hypothetical protein n=1 Tax=Streptomyces sp. CAU 1734 TaxID=3140360 RepID=UPI0032607DCD